MSVQEKIHNAGILFALVRNCEKQSYKKDCLPVAIVVYVDVGVLVVVVGDIEAIATMCGVARHRLHNNWC